MDHNLGLVPVERWAEPTTKNIAWLAGFLEGEGCFYYSKTPVIILSSTDLDVVEKAASILRIKRIKPHIPTQQQLGSKTQHKIKMTGSSAAAWMQTLYVLLGTRRQSKIREVLGIWKNAHRGGPEFCINGHVRATYFKIEKNGRRRCVLCHRADQQRYKWRKK